MKLDSHAAISYTPTAADKALKDKLRGGSRRSGHRESDRDRDRDRESDIKSPRGKRDDKERKGGDEKDKEKEGDGKDEKNDTAEGGKAEVRQGKHSTLAGGAGCKQLEEKA